MPNKHNSRAKAKMKRKTHQRARELTGEAADNPVMRQNILAWPQWKDPNPSLFLAPKPPDLGFPNTQIRGTNTQPNPTETSSKSKTNPNNTLEFDSSAAPKTPHTLPKIERGGSRSEEPLQTLARNEMRWSEAVEEEEKLGFGGFDRLGFRRGEILGEETRREDGEDERTLQSRDGVQENKTKLKLKINSCYYIYFFVGNFTNYFFMRIIPTDIVNYKYILTRFNLPLQKF